MDLVILHRIASGIRFPTVTAAKVHNNKNAQKSTDDIETQYHMTHLLNGSRRIVEGGIGKFFLEISIAQTCDSAVNLIGRIVRFRLSSHHGHRVQDREYWFEFNSWWTGPNVCKEESVKEKPATNETNFHPSITSTCISTYNVHSCESSKIINGKEIINTTTYQCCHGFARNFKKGCLVELELEDLATTLKNLNLTLLEESLEKSGLLTQLDKRNITLFAPTNEAFSQSSSDGSEIAQVIVFETGDTMRPVKDILLGYISPGFHYSFNLKDGNELQTLRTGGKLTVSVNKNNAALSVNCAEIKNANVQFKNGVLHVVNKPLFPATETIWEMLNSNPEFSIFLSLMNDSTKEMLNNKDLTLTVFAFNDEAFQKLPQQVQSDIRSKRSCFADFMHYYIMEKMMCKNMLSHDLNILDIFFLSHKRNEDSIIENLNLTGEGRVGLNGILHTITEVYIPQKARTLYSAIQESISEEMASLFEKSGITKILSTESATVLLPPTSAVTEIGNMEANSLQNEISRYVVIGEKYNFEEPSKQLSSLAKQNLKFSREMKNMAYSLIFESKQKKYVNCVAVEKSNIPSCNAVLHKLSEPLPKYGKTLMDVLRGMDNVKQFVMLMETSGLDKSLSDPEFSATVLAFEDDAFDNIYKDTDKENLLANKSDVELLMKRHIIPVSLCCYKLCENTLFGNSFRAMDGMKQCNAAVSDNGVVHILQSPLYPARAYNFINFPFIDSLAIGRPVQEFFSNKLVENELTISQNRHEIAFFIYVKPRFIVLAFPLRRLVLNCGCVLAKIMSTSGS
ncbi:Transforming growth factor-beta-induced protein [Trichinella spiralis]|uniref:Transforming growth factor-beta-induced protein n=1 Tax=Trichinella spiralis TaxID=6334 RepID=A0ABR3KTI8_TRISP